MGALAEAIERCGGLAVRERGVEVALRQRGIGGLETGAEHTALVAAAEVMRPEGVRLVFQHLAAYERKRLLERAPSLPSGLARRPLNELVEPVEIEFDEIGRETVRLLLGDNELPGSIAIRDEMPAKDGDEGLDGCGIVFGPPLTPDQLGDPVGRNTVPSGCEEDFEHLFRSCSSEIPGTQSAVAVLDLEATEEADHRSLPMVCRASLVLFSAVGTGGESIACSAREEVAAVGNARVTTVEGRRSRRSA